MKIDRFQGKNWLVHHHVDLAFSPLTIVCGPNGAGKSSIRDGIAYAMLAETCRVESKSARDLLVTDGADRGLVTLICEGVTVSRSVSTGKLSAAAALPVPEKAAKAAAPFLLDPPRFAGLTDDDKRSLLLSVMRVDVGAAALKKELAAREHAPDRLAELPDDKPVQDWPKIATAKASECRGAWKAATGETYGSLKAETWEIGLAAYDRTGLQNDRTRADDLQTKLRGVQSRLEAETGAARQAQAHRAKVAELQNKIGDVDVLRSAADEAQNRLEEATSRHEAAVTHLNDLKGRLATAHQKCPHCSQAVSLDLAGGLTKYSPPDNPTTRADVTTAADEAEKLLCTVDAARKAATKAKETLASAEAASAALADVSVQEYRGSEEDASELAAEATELRSELGRVHARVDEALSIVASNTKAELANRNAKEAHAGVKAWTALAAALEPSGVPGELLARALAPFNDTMRSVAATTGWPQVSIDAAMVIRGGTRLYGLMCESEKWRVDAAIAVALAQHSDLRFVLLDRFDVLDTGNRNMALRWLLGLTRTGALDTAIVFGTLKQAPSVPLGVGTHWLGERAGQGEQAA